MMFWVSLLSALLLLSTWADARTCQRQSSKDLQSFEHGTRGLVGITSGCRLKAKNFSYDGLGPDVWWYYSTTGCSPKDFASNGGRLSSVQIKRAYNGASASWPIRSSVNTKDVACIALYCEEYKAIFGSVAV